MTREEWLERALDLIRGLFREQDVELSPKIRVSCGWPSVSARSAKKRRIGECWHPEHARDKHVNIFISPCLDSGAEVLGVLVHEAVHAHLDSGVGHRGPFQRLAKSLGLEAPWTATKVGPDLARRLNNLMGKLGAYPHGALKFTTKVKKQGTRMLKVECEKCGYIARVTKKWLDDVGPPICPSDQVPMSAEDTEENGNTNS